MYLTEIAEAIRDAIQASPPGDWGGGLVVPDDIPVFFGLDPFSESNSVDTGIYVIPGYNEYDLSNSRQTGLDRTGVRKINRLSVIICKPFDAVIDINDIVTDVSQVSEWSLLSNLREDLENFLVHLIIPGLKLVEIEPEPPDEVAMDNRLYFAPTALGYHSC